LNKEIHFEFFSALDALRAEAAHTKTRRVFLIIIAKQMLPQFAQYRQSRQASSRMPPFARTKPTPLLPSPLRPRKQNPEPKSRASKELEVYGFVKEVLHKALDKF